MKGNHFKLYWFEEVDSTMDIAREFAKKGEEACILAETQTSGRGRWARKWYSPKGGLWFSISLLQTFSKEKLVFLPYITSLAVLFSIKETTRISAGIKWPNDILYQGKKLAGILLERGEEYVILGVGINVNNEPPFKEFSISLKEILKTDVDRLLILTQFLKYFYEFLNKEKMEIIALWEKHSVTINKKVKVITSSCEIMGIAKKLSDDGALMIIDKENKVRKVFSGECIQFFDDSVFNDAD